MNHKITFQELINAIAEQSGKSKQFAHDFTKDFASVIKESLEKDGTINIAGFGKFDLKKIDEHEEFDPQTKENITIPAHNKIEFTPNKDLRELVNAPYSHMEPEVIEESESEEPVSEEDEESMKDTTESPGPSSSEGEESEKKKAPWEEDMESEIEVDEDDPFGLNADRKERVPFSFDDEEEKEEDSEDIVEFTPGVEPEEETDEDDRKADGRQDTDDLGESFEAERNEEEQQTASDSLSPDKGYTPNSTPSFRSRRHRERDSGGGSTFWIIAAAFIILLLAIGSWYVMDVQQSQTPESMGAQTAQSDIQEDQQQDSEQATEDQQEQEAEEDQPAAKDEQQQAVPGDKAPPVETITVSAGQTLWGLADNEYNNPYLWPWIYDTNKASIDNPNIIYIGQALDIPQRRGSDNGLSASDSLQVALGYVETYLWYKENELENAKFYLYAAKRYHSRVFEYADADIDEADLRFANRAQ